MTPIRSAVTLALVLSAGVAHAQNPIVSSPVTRTQVVVLGSGTPVADPDRFGPAVVIVVDSSVYLFDAGVGVVRRWAGALKNGVAPLNPAGIRTAFITHLHTDHTLGLPELIFSSWTLSNDSRPFDLYGPPGLRAMTRHILEAYEEDIEIRTGAGGEKANSGPPVVRAHEIDSGVVYHDRLVSVTAFPVKHGTWKHAFGYRVQTPDKVIVLSGDTSPSETVARECSGCDILVHEGGSVTDSAATPYFRKFHTTVEGLARIANMAKPKMLVLYHQRPTSPATARAYALLKTLYSGSLVVARDLDVFR
ncbi:MAG TPA: MBL fold metallo-hydrolase [Gemmatimonadaceae bacterium]|nr:MBL fold metallo-hydrolase [Gemmatimonadaceae bacterium]